MDFNKAVKKSISNFLDGQIPEAVMQQKEGMLVFTPEYFDQLEQDLLDQPTDSTKAKEEEEVDEV